jgi:endonuclease/exonuclease/phosphatase family metal-dependent hydrolase
MVASVIRFNNADIIGLQEALKIQLEDLKELLPGYSWVGSGRDDGKDGGEFSAILFNKNRFEVSEYKTFWLSSTPDVPSKGWDAAYKRITTWVKFIDKKTNKVFYHFNCHFDHVGEQARLNSALLLKKKITEYAFGFPLVLTGDFNVRSDSQVYKVIISDNEIQLFDAENISRYGNYGSDVTFNNFGGEIIPGNKIDFIFVNDKVQVLQHGVIGDTFNGQYPSDHMPVLAEIVIN